jgi:capsular exopolysaccharide synthesis family protein
MDLKDNFNVLWRRKWIVILTTIAALAVAIGGTQLIKPTYETSTTVRVAAAASGPLGATAASVSNQLINTAAQIAVSQPMREQVAAKLQLKQQPVITAEVIPQTELIKITVQYSNPQTAAQIANTLADMLITQSNELYLGGKVTVQDVLAEQLAQYKADMDAAQKAYDALLVANPTAPAKVAAALDALQLKQRSYESLLLEYDNALLQKQVRASMMTVVERAVAPGAPIAPQRTYNYLIGLVLGLFFGIVLAFVAENFDPTLQTSKQVENATALDIVARIPRTSKRNATMTRDASSGLAEAYRSLASTLIGDDVRRAERLILLTSAEPQQGKTTATANLAIALAEHGMNVVVVDCDMRRPELQEMFDIPNEIGLSEVLMGKADLKKELRHPADWISVLTSGSQPANASHLLGSSKMAEVVDTLRQEFDFVLLDTPALLAVSDTRALVQNSGVSQHVQAALLVVRQGHAQRDAVQAAAKFMKRFGEHGAGIVLNGTGNMPGFAYYRTRRMRNADISPSYAEQNG